MSDRSKAIAHEVAAHQVELHDLENALKGNVVLLPSAVDRYARDIFILREAVAKDGGTKQVESVIVDRHKADPTKIKISVRRYTAAVASGLSASGSLEVTGPLYNFYQ